MEKSPKNGPVTELRNSAEGRKEGRKGGREGVRGRVIRLRPGSEPKTRII